MYIFIYIYIYIYIYISNILNIYLHESYVLNIYFAEPIWTRFWFPFFDGIFIKFFKESISFKFLHENLTNYVDTFLSKFISAYRKYYSSNHVFIRLIESCKKSLDQKTFVGVVLMDLSKVFDSIPHDLLIAKIRSMLTFFQRTPLYSFIHT